MQHGELAVVQVHDAARVARERGRVGCNEHLVVAEAENHGAAVACHDERLRLLCVEHGKTVGARHEPQCSAHALLERVAGHRGDEMGENFGIRLRLEHDALRFQSGS